jgi:hypothetical protein
VIRNMRSVCMILAAALMGMLVTPALAQSTVRQEYDPATGTYRTIRTTFYTPAYGSYSGFTPRYNNDRFSIYRGQPYFRRSVYDDPYDPYYRRSVRTYGSPYYGSGYRGNGLFWGR